MEIAIDAMESGLEAMEIAMDAIESGAKQTLGYGHCHGCDGKWSKTDTWLG